LKKSIVSYPKRGPYGDNKFRGNTSGYLIKDLIEEYKLQGYKINTVLDPMEGSGTTRDVCKELKIDYTGYDLKIGFNLITDPLPDEKYDFIFIHPPYWNIIRYSDNPNDLSNAKTIDNFTGMLTNCLNKCWNVLKKGGLLVMQIGDKRQSGKYYFLLGYLNWKVCKIKDIIIKEQHNVTSNGWYYNRKFIPIMHEFIVVWKK